LVLVNSTFDESNHAGRRLTDQQNLSKPLISTEFSHVFLSFYNFGTVKSPGKDKRYSSFPKRPDGLWGPPSLLRNGYRKESGLEERLTTHI
jgi:hypothetical protein